MKQDRTALRRERGEHGQVLILAVVALILVIIATLLLFDVQTVIRGKIKGQNGVDAAALTAAEWQKHSLNLIGELNLARATATLISDPFFARGVLEPPNSNEFNDIIPDGFQSLPEFFADLPKPITQEKFTLFPEKAEFYNSDGSLNVEKLIQEVVRVEKEKRYLDAVNKLISQLQTRIAFVGPLIAFGAAQQAAKNNGITSNPEAGDFCQYYLDSFGNNGIYDRVSPVFVNDYAWRAPYLSMIDSIFDYSTVQNDLTGHSETRPHGIAAGTKVKLASMPSLVTDPPTDLSVYLGDPNFYDMIHARDWCGLDRLLRLDFGENWWGGFECDFEQDFSNQSEILPLHITFSDLSPDIYNEANKKGALARYKEDGKSLFHEIFNDEIPYKYDVETNEPDPDPIQSSKDKIIYYFRSEITITINSALFEQDYNDEDADRRYNLLPRLSWATYDEEWGTYDNDKQEWEEYLRGSFKPGMDYRSGALAYFEAQQDTVTVTGSMGRPRRGSWSPDVGQVFSGTAAKANARAISGTLNSLNNNRSINKIETNAEAKPIGRIKTEDGQYLRPFEAGGMVLPVFTETALIPIAMEPVEGISMLRGDRWQAQKDIGWLYYLTEFIPLLSGSSSIKDAWEQAVLLYPNHLGDFAYYAAALNMLDNPEFRQAGLDWLDATAVWTRDENGNRVTLYTNREYHCLGMGRPDPPPSSGGNGGGGGGSKQSKGGPVPAH